MKNYKLIIILIFFITEICFAQSSQQDTTDDCLTPYHPRLMSENYDRHQIDFSREFYKSRLKCFSRLPNKINVTNTLKKYDCSSIWTKYSDIKSQNGIIGDNYQRIQIHIHKAIKHKNDFNKYLVFGKSKINDNICNFEGSIRIVNATEYKESEITSPQNNGILLAEYYFIEKCGTRKGGTFKGVVESEFILDDKLKKAFLDDSNDIADGYFNNTFVGTWLDHSRKRTKTCIWGDYRLPFTFDFDDGDGEMIVNEKYKKNGWESYINGSDKNDKWWLQKKKTPNNAIETDRE